MKKSNVFLILTLTCCLLLGGLNKGQTQNTKHEITLGYGVFTTSDILDFFSDMLTTGLTLGTVNSKNYYTGTMYVGYKYSVADRIGVGTTFLYEVGKFDILFNERKIGETKNNYYTLALELDFKYIKTKYLSFYGMLGAGGTLRTEKYTAIDNTSADNEHITHFNFQITPIGIKVGSRFGLYSELGFGYKGIITAGVFLRL